MFKDIITNKDKKKLPNKGTKFPENFLMEVAYLRYIIVVLSA